MAKLVQDDEIYAYLGESQADDQGGIIIALRDAAEELLEANTNRVFGPGVILTQEQYDGPGGHLIFTRRPIDVLTKIEFRYLPEVIQELYFTLDIMQYVTWTPGKRRIHSRIWPFPLGYDNILITYTSQDDMPPRAKAAVKDVVARAFRNIGQEGYKSEKKGSYSYALEPEISKSSMWSMAVETLNIPLIG
jgi:hypothetical protein